MKNKYQAGAFFTSMTMSIDARPAKLGRPATRNSEYWGNLRLDVLAHHTVDGKLHCSTCGRPLTVQQTTIHRMRYPGPGEHVIPARDLMPICAKCHQVIQINPEMQDPGLSKRQLCRMVRVYYVEKKTRSSRGSQHRLRPAPPSLPRTRGARSSGKMFTEKPRS